MNLVMASVLLLTTLAFQPTLIYGSKGLASSAASGRKSGKKYTPLTSSSLKTKLPQALASNDVLARATRGADEPPAAAATDTTIGNNSGGGGSVTGGKRGKNNKQRSNKNSTPENAPTTGGAGRKQHLDKKYTSANNQQQQQQEQQQQRGHNNKGKQRQLLKSSQQHQNHGKRAGNKPRSENGEKAGDTEKQQSTCRYAKSAWSECDAKTNMRTRTLTLKKGESNCLPTRTMQKKCKKTCRYEKGAWSECSSGQMTRQDQLKSTGGSGVAASTGGDSSCEPVRNINRKCNPGGGAAGVGGRQGGKSANKERKNKDKASRRTPQPQA